MRRRDAMAGAVGIGAVLLSGCVSEVAPSGPRNPPGEGDARSDDPSEDDERDPGLFVAGFDFFEGEDGTLVVAVTVGNDATSERSGTVVVTASTPDEEYEETAPVTVAPDEESAVEVSLGMEYETFEREGNLFVDVEE